MVRDPVQERLVEIISEKRKNVPPARAKTAPAAPRADQRGQHHGRAPPERRGRSEGEEGQAARRPVGRGPDPLVTDPMRVDGGRTW